jgi:hypothetical protein
MQNGCQDRKKGGRDVTQASERVSVGVVLVVEVKSRVILLGRSSLSAGPGARSEYVLDDTRAKDSLDELLVGALRGIHTTRRVRAVCVRAALARTESWNSSYVNTSSAGSFFSLREVMCHLIHARYERVRRCTRSTHLRRTMPRAFATTL